MARLPNRFASRSPGRDEIVARTMRWFDDGNLLSLLRPRIARRTESQRADSTADLTAYLTEEITPTLEALGFVSRLVDNPTGGTPFLIARRHEGDDLPTVLTYAHGDVIHGYDAQWRTGLSPWNIVVEGDRWYGRGTADNKGQHTINLAALAQVLAYKGALGFNVTLLMEMGEEIGSPGLRAFCERERTALAADVLIASDGPRLSAGRPTLFLGSRGAFNFELGVDLRAAAHHSGNWGGLLANAGTVLANAIAALVDRRGRILVSALRPPPIPASVARALADIAPGETGGPAIDLHIHDTHFIGLVAGVPERVFSNGVVAKDGFVEYLTTQYLYGPGGPALTCSSGALAMRARPFVHGFEIYLERATLVYSSAGQPLIVLQPEAEPE